MSMADIQALAARVDDAARGAKAIAQLTGEVDLSIDDAYEIQRASIGRRLERGEKQVGMKMGFTSRAKIIQMGVSDMIWGRLTSGMIVEDGGSISMKRYVHPRVEPEVAFLLKAPLSGAITPLQALSAVEAIAPAMEIIDSRYEKFKFSHIDVVADNTSGAGFVTGPWHRPDIDFSNLGMVLSFSGKPVQIGSSAAILGHPLRSLVSAARFAAEAGEPLQPGWIIMAGGATAAEALTIGAYVEHEVQHLGRVAFTVTP
jgi:2-oxo-3-hexenedioate decarboxylase